MYPIKCFLVSVGCCELVHLVVVRGFAAATIGRHEALGPVSHIGTNYLYSHGLPTSLIADFIAPSSCLKHVTQMRRLQTHR
jgi:hypothetical protein